MCLLFTLTKHIDIRISYVDYVQFKAVQVHVESYLRTTITHYWVCLLLYKLGVFVHAYHIKNGGNVVNTQIIAHPLIYLLETGLFRRIVGVTCKMVTLDASQISV